MLNLKNNSVKRIPNIESSHDIFSERGVTLEDAKIYFFGSFIDFFRLFMFLLLVWKVLLRFLIGFEGNFELSYWFGRYF